MYYYYYYYYGSTSEVKIKLNFEAENPKEVMLEDFQEFLQAFTNVHKHILVRTQPEYQFDKNPCDISKVALISYHSFRLNTISRENPFFVELIFDILRFSNNPVWAIWKILIRICKKYGKTADDLNRNVNRLKNYIDEAIREYNSIFRNEAINNLLGVKQINEDELHRIVFGTILSLLKDDDFTKWYNILCKESITITSLLSIVDEETIKLIPAKE